MLSVNSIVMSQREILEQHITRYGCECINIQNATSRVKAVSKACRARTGGQRTISIRNASTHAVQDLVHEPAPAGDRSESNGGSPLMRHYCAARERMHSEEAIVSQLTHIQFHHVRDQIKFSTTYRRKEF